MKTKIDILIVIMVASLSLVACVEEEIKVTLPDQTQTANGVSNTNAPIK